MQASKEDNCRIICTVCGKEVSLLQGRRFSVYRFLHEGKHYPVYEYICPFCSAKMYVSQKFLDDLSTTNSSKKANISI